MSSFNYIVQFTDIFLYTWLTLIMFRRTVCRGLDITQYNLNFSRFKVLLRRNNYYSDIMLLVGCIIAVCKLSNDFFNYKLMDKDIIRSIYWLIFHKLITISLLIAYRNSQPKIITHLIQDIKETIHEHTNNLFKRSNKTSDTV